MLSSCVSFFEVQVPSHRQMFFCGIAKLLATVKQYQCFIYRQGLCETKYTLINPHSISVHTCTSLFLRQELNRQCSLSVGVHYSASQILVS